MGCSAGYSNGEIRDRFERLYYNIFRNIINFDGIKKGNLFLNLIHYDKNLKNEENTEYYRYFSINIVGSYYAFDDFDMLKYFISKLNKSSFCCSYILMTSGSEAEKVLEEFNKYDFLIEFIIFYFKGKYDYLKDKYNKIKLITKKFNEIAKFLQSKKFSKKDLIMDNHLPVTPLITYYDYKKCLFPIHRILAYFFKYDIRGYSRGYFLEAKKYIDNSIFEEDTKEKILYIMEDLIMDRDKERFSSEWFPKKCIQYYTGENLCYVFNKSLRNFDKFYVEMAYFIGPFYYGLFEYALRHREKILNKKTILYRDLIMDRLDLYFYQFCENDIICFPSFTSTTLKENLNFKPTKNSAKINNIGNLEEKNYVKMIINHNPKGLCVPQGLDVSEESKHSNEKEILLFPFTFLKIDKVELHSGNENDKHYIYLTIINRENIF